MERCSVAHTGAVQAETAGDCSHRSDRGEKTVDENVVPQSAPHICPMGINRCGGKFGSIQLFKFTYPLMWQFYFYGNNPKVYHSRNH